LTSNILPGFEATSGEEDIYLRFSYVEKWQKRPLDVADLMVWIEIV
jgi:hypothetical protein